MMGFVPQMLPQAYIESKPFAGLGDTGYPAPPLVQAAPTNSVAGSGGWMGLVTGLVGGAFQSGTNSSFEFNAAANQIRAQSLASERSRRWAAIGALAIGVAGLAGVVYLLRK